MASKNLYHGFSGRLDNFPLLDVIQMACVAQRNGRLQIRNGEKRGEIVLQKGQIIHVRTSLKTGEEALLEILCWERGRFIFSHRESGQGGVRSIEGGWEHVLMETVRRRDEKLYPVQATPMFPGLRSELADSILKRLDGQRKRRQSVRWAIRLLLSLSVAAAVFLANMHQTALLSAFSGARQWVDHNFISLHQWKKRNATQIVIAPGSFIYQDGQSVFLPSFEIDETEIPVWEYAEFLKAVGNRKEFNHPNQPPEKEHINARWVEYSRAAFALQEFQGVRLNPNYPAAFIDWYDAFAFAAWKGRELPTEQQWEKAARGTDGRTYPWGNNFQPGNSLQDTANHLASWHEVGAVPRDRSPYGVLDMAGNVAEWTNSWNEQGDPIVRGSNFRSGDGMVARRVEDVSPLTVDERIGFRTVRKLSMEKHSTEALGTR